MMISKSSLVKVLLTLSLAFCGVTTAKGEVAISMIGSEGHFATPEEAADFQQTDKMLGDSLTTLVLTDLIELAKSAEFKKCGVVLVEWEHRDAYKKEMELGKSKYADKSTFPKGPMKEPNIKVHGSISISNNVAKWTMKSDTTQPGRTIDLSGELPADNYMDGTKEIAKQIIKAVCKTVPVHIVIKMNDLKIDQVVCDIGVPFTLHGTGKTAGLSFDMVPSSNIAGGWTVSGTAGGVVWSGGGNYIFERVAKSDTVKLSGNWHIKTPVGVFPYAGAAKGKATEVTDKCAG